MATHKKKYRIVEELKDGQFQYYCIEEFKMQAVVIEDLKTFSGYSYKYEERWVPINDPSVWRTNNFQTLEAAEEYVKKLLKPPPVYTRAVVKEYFS